VKIVEILENLLKIIDICSIYSKFVEILQNL